jgi:hypothetical protein
MGGVQVLDIYAAVRAEIRQEPIGASVNVVSRKYRLSRLD